MTIIRHNRKGNRYLTDEEREWLTENFPRLGEAETTEQYNKIFGKNKTKDTLARYCHRRLGLKVSAERMAHRYDDHRAKVGDIFKNCRGEWKIKTEKGWVPLAHAFGEVPQGYIAFHLDGNRDNNTKENIMIIKNGLQTIVRNENMMSENPEITKTAICWAELYSALKKEELKNEKRDKKRNNIQNNIYSG